MSNWFERLFSSDTSATWNSAQQARLQQERTILARYFRNFSWEDPRTPGKARVVGTLRSNSGRRYELQLMVPVDVPNSVPDLFLHSPSPLPDHWGRSLASYGLDSSMHLLTPENGYLKICHYRPSLWMPDVTFYKVLMKGRLWIEAYEGHRSTGKSIDHYLKHQ